MYQQLYYGGLFALSFFMTLLYVYHWHKQFQVHLTAAFLLIPIVNLGYLLMYTYHEPETAVAMLKIVYIGGCYLPWLITMCELRLCRIEIPRSLRMGTLLISTVIYVSVLTVGHLPLFYRSLTLEQLGSAWVLRKEYGPFHALHYVCLSLYLLADIVALLYSYRRQKQVSRVILFLLFLPIPATIFSYFVNRSMMAAGFEAMPLAFVLSQIIYLLIVQRMTFYNVTEMVVEGMVQSGDVGFITMDSRGRYLGSNETARRVLPGLSLVTVDRPVRTAEPLRDTVAGWLDCFQRDPDSARFLYTWTDPEKPGEEKVYAVSVSRLTEGKVFSGYQILLRDDTQNQKYIQLLDQYNIDLQKDVAAKTERIEVMHDRLILGMAAMVESRDNSTGGHIRRTSQGVRILIEAIRADGSLHLSEEFCRNIIKAAPMHDLGKIAVDDAVLRKPGHFTPEEYEKMKAHAAEGARIVHEILRDTEDEDFRRIAENVAHYHHERMDGSGYPDGLKGEEIPLEARIMAIADVYDALVSRRVYKDAFSFEKADRILMEGMGKQFDPALEQYYIAARPRLEAYYAAEMKP